MVFTSKHNAVHMKNVIVCVGGINITSVIVMNLGVIFDSAMNMEQKLNNTCRSGYHQLCNIRQIRRYLTHGATKSLVNGIITSRLEYCNALLSGHAQNSAAQIITRTSRCSRITPILKDLLWFPVNHRV